jgi:hypothetical protein
MTDGRRSCEAQTNTNHNENLDIIAFDPPITVGERGRELFVPSTNGTIVPNHDMGNGMNITFNIQANDVRGIKELLIDNRATIINLVNQGANAKGKSNIV